MTGTMYGQPQVSPYLQSQQQQTPFGQAMSSHPFAQQSQASALPLPQVLQALAQQLGQLNQHNQQQSQLLQQLIQIVPQQLQQIQQFLQVLPQVIHQQSQIHQQPFAQGAGAFGPSQQPFGGSSTWSGGMPQQGATGGQPGVGANLGFPTLGGQPGQVM